MGLSDIWADIWADTWADARTGTHERRRYSRHIAPPRR